ncbi:MAG TPA: hypothetical protein VJB65_01460 [Patescibacteria group bacterium]|nr:hypothetical protein [Patescibacteria group bacterium]
MKLQPQNRIGLHKAFPVDKKPLREYAGGEIFGQLFNDINNAVGLPPTELYAFGWTGLLSCKSRRKSAEILYKAIKDLYYKTKKQGDNPRFRIIAYSHGGNTALHMGEAARNNGYTPFKIDELILVSTPVHINTQFYLQNGLFKNVYLFYSKGDNIQSSDFVSSPTHSFAHHFFHKKHGPLPHTITQVQIRIFRTHIKIPQKDGTFHIMPKYEMVHPNHTEMFFFGWAPEWYRKYFPIKPLSVGLLIPFFLKTINEQHLNGKHIRMTLYPEKENMTIKIKDGEGKKEKELSVPFFTKQELTHFRKELQEFKPDNVTYKEYRTRMKKHWNEAKKSIRDSVKRREKIRKQKKQLKGQQVCNVSLFAPVVTESRKVPLIKS